MSTPTMESTWAVLLEEVAALSDRPKDGKLLDKVDAAIKDLVFYDDQLATDEYLVHYTSWERALAILKEPEPLLRSYNYEWTNDPKEGKLRRKAWDGLAASAERMDKLLPSNDQALLRSGRSTGSTFGCCFSTGGSGVEDNLTFWRLYGNDGNGCSFKVTSRLNNTYRVRYLDEDRRNRNNDDEELDRRVGSLLNDLLTSVDKHVNQFLVHRTDVARGIAARARKVLSGYNHLVKASDFEDEKEWRMIDVFPTNAVLYDTDEAGVVRRYVSGLPLERGLITGSSITVGPQVPNGGAARAYVEHLVKAYVERMEAKGTEALEGGRGPAQAVPVVNLSKQTYRSTP